MYPFLPSEINECASNPCKNGGLCTNGIGLYSCSCPIGLIGDRCEIGKTITTFHNQFILILWDIVFNSVFSVKLGFLSKQVMLFTLLLPAVCDTPLGMEDGRILDSQITASSELTENDLFLGATNARLNHSVGYNGTSGSWSAAASNATQWIQVDLGVSKMVSGIVLQGREENNQWVTKYKVDYSEDTVPWMLVKDINQQDIAVRYISSSVYSVVPGANHKPLPGNKSYMAAFLK